jgi:uncharacterized lipoprotein NlpE involved in copper resistance
MIKIFTALAVIITLWGCSNDNKITIQNLATNPIYLNFRAQIYTVPGMNDKGQAGTIPPITEIPNGTFDYKTMWDVPSNLTISIAPEADGELTFNHKSTSILMQYGSAATATQYITSLTVTSSDSKNPVATQ